ncbi:phosphate ABC transporter substrate-binding protein PstS [Pseudonocardia acaciae]|uniref:phosphate ABC transporter substrate-binding protein PstS n=1 Tax=Pseudonocardia acaciae TaxID=551276 RepID=UPI00048B7E47|nr:phosphate ABC transporter substrate-binding protein PstS [Pseudonocardia acaciae]
MKLKRHGAVLALAAAGAMALAACGSNPTPSGGGGGGAGGAAPGVNCGGKQNLSAEGSSAQKNAVDVFIQAYQQQCGGKNLAYNPTGSGAGVKQFNAGLVDFGGSDSALKDAEVAAAQQRCKGNPAWNLPLVFGPVAIAYKLDGVTGLTLNGETAAKIFNGQIKTWNDPAIAALNSGAQLPNTPISVVFRSDESGTTDNFQQYLQAAGKGAWTQGAGKKFNGGVGSGANQSAGVAQSVSGANGSITYVELSYAQDNKLSMAKLDSGSGPVELNSAAVGKAIETAKVTGQGNDLKLDLKSVYGGNTAGAYPLILATYEIVCSKGYDPDVAQAVKAFLTTAATSGQAQLPDAGYAPLPESFKAKLLTAIQAIA